jgi:hypothetical protein
MKPLYLHLAPGRRLLALGLSALGLFFSISLFLKAGAIGLSSMFVRHAVTTAELGYANRATELTPRDPEVRYYRARLLADLDLPTDAANEYQEAVRLRPHDYGLLLDCGLALEQAGDPERALGATKRAVSLAPNFAGPRWQLGNLLFRMRRFDEAFEELRRAGSIDPNTLLAGLLDLAWATSGGNVGRFEGYIQPQTNRERLEVARFYASHGRPDEAVKQVRATPNLSEEADLGLVKLVVNNLIAAKDFPQAFEIWSSVHGNAAGNERLGDGKFVNGGFEEPIRRDDYGFGWQLASDTTGLQVAIDPAERRSGSYSLRIGFEGTWTPVLSQMLLVQPGVHYVLRFYARTQGLTTGGAPIVAVFDLGGKEQQALGVSRPIVVGTSGWQEYTAEFSTKQARTVAVSLERQNCESPQCPIFGDLWLDEFSLSPAPK